MFKENGVKAEKELTTNKTYKNYLKWRQQTIKFCIIWPHQSWVSYGTACLPQDPILSWATFSVFLSHLYSFKIVGIVLPQRLLHRATSLEKEREEYHGGLRWDSILNAGFTLTSYVLGVSFLTSPFFSLLICKMDSRNKSCELEQCLANSKHSINIRCCYVIIILFNSANI